MFGGSFESVPQPIRKLLESQFEAAIYDAMGKVKEGNDPTTCVLRANEVIVLASAISRSTRKETRS